MRTLEGAVMAVWNADGGLKQTVVLQAADDFRVPIPSNSLSVYPLRGVWASQELSRDGWTDVASATGTGSTMLKVPAASSVVAYLGSVSPLAPRVIDRSSTRSSEEITPFHGRSRETLHAKLEADDLKNSSVAAGAVCLQDRGRGSQRRSLHRCLMALGGVPSMAVGRVVSGRPTGAAAVFRVDTMGLLRTPDRTSEVLLMARDDQAQLIGDGWSAVEWDAVSAYRWMTRTEARLLLPIAKPDAQRIRMQALLEEGGAPRNGVASASTGSSCRSQPLRIGWNAYEWTAPPADWRSGSRMTSS